MQFSGALASILKDSNDSVLISETDPFGTIIHANDNFCTISQYSREELVGSSHNIIRHPSMPKELFQFLWSTLKSGEVFRGIIKNLKKDGNHYWVNATIIPVFQNGKVSGYIGGRNLIKDDSVAEQLFAEEVRRYHMID
jgi:PAS domain S-box-containing protein